MIDHLCQRGWAVVDEFLPHAEALRLSVQEEMRWKEGLFRAGRVGHDRVLESPDVRSDSIRWLGDEVEYASFFQAIDALLERLRLEAHLPLRGREFHAAVYEPGRFYEKHLDVSEGSRSPRLVSCVYYLNPQWEAQDEGALKIYSSEGPVEILPVLNRLVIFQSRSIPHEVKPPLRRPRFSLTGWLRASESY